MSNYESIIEQNNTELQSNNTDLQGLLDTINALPVAENLDAALEDYGDAITEQDALIANIQTALAGKAGATPQTCTVTFINNGGSGFVYSFLTFVDAEGTVYENISCDSLGSSSLVFTVPCPSVIAITGIANRTPSGNATYVGGSDEAYLITGDASFGCYSNEPY